MSFKHLLNIKSLDRATIETLFQRADYYLKKFVTPNKIAHILKGKVVTHLFFEPSTRTRNSFKIAAERLGAITLSPELSVSSLAKGESVRDTINAFIAMGTSAFVIRHSENDIYKELTPCLDQAVFINAGNGVDQHPTQALIDLFTIQQHKKQWSSLQIAILGDVVHSRVAHSLIDGLTIMGVKQIRLIGPSSLLPNNLSSENKIITANVDEGLVDCDAIICLRLQKERMSNFDMPDEKSFYREYGLTAHRLAVAPNAIVMHPGPMNRNVEIASDVADGKQSVILQQVRNGVAIRMAVLDLFSKRNR